MKQEATNKFQELFQNILTATVRGLLLFYFNTQVLCWIWKSQNYIVSTFQLSGQRNNNEHAIS